jgi:hypothetical protein
MAEIDPVRTRPEKMQLESNTPIKQELHHSRPMGIRDAQTVNGVEQNSGQMLNYYEGDNGRGRKRARANTNGIAYAVHEKGQPIIRDRDEDGYVLDPN